MDQRRKWQEAKVYLRGLTKDYNYNFTYIQSRELRELKSIPHEVS